MKRIRKPGCKAAAFSAAFFLCGLVASTASARTYFFDACGTVTVNGTPTSNVLVTAWGCEGSSILTQDVVFASDVSNGQISNNYHVVYTVEAGDPGSSRALDAYLVFSYGDCDPVIVECDVIHDLNSLYRGKIILDVDILCEGPPGGGGHTPGYWQNKNGQARISNDDVEMLNECCLRNEDGSDADFTDKVEFKKWLKSRRAKNMAYQLSGHLAAMKLNVAEGFVNGGALVYIDGDDMISINDLMDAADDALCEDGLTFKGDENRDDQEVLKNALDKANNNQNWVNP